jgi:hypothetical protein
MFSVLKGLLHGFSNVVVVILFSVSWFMRPSNPVAPGMTAMMLGWIVRTLDNAISFARVDVIDRRGPFALCSPKLRA